MKQEVKHGKKMKEYAKVLLKQGLSYAEIENETGIPTGYLRVMKTRLKETAETPEKQPAPAKAKTPKAAEKAPEMPQKAPETGFPQKRTVEQWASENVPGFFFRMVFRFTSMDALYYVTAYVTAVSIVTLLPVTGFYVASAYLLISIGVLQMSKDESSIVTAEAGQSAVWFLKVITAAVCYAAFNKELWANRNSLPFEIKDKCENGVWFVQNAELPSYIAFGFALIFAGAGVWAVYMTLKQTKERAKNKAVLNSQNT